MSSYTPLLMTPADIAHLIRRPEGTVKRWAHEGRITSHGGQYDFLELQGVASGAVKRPPKKATLTTAA
ncbi:MAG: MerR family DNA-binding transcriptional regulator [Streptomyces sp.]|nr:MerR family DNA-binding transcriptional regulator [Streptomyces sp.]NUS23420.1 MerR family DNA-binding transcriptional regulator [Streptomyces sp.]